MDILGLGHGGSGARLAEASIGSDSAFGGRLWVQCARKNNHGPARKQTNKPWERLRRGDSRSLSRHWNEQARGSIASSPVLKDWGGLAWDEALGQVISAQANYMTVVVEQAGEEQSESPRTGTRLLCVVRAVLKKIKRRVMVGDKVVVSGIDWADKRGMIEEVMHRKSETSDPPVANVDMLLVLFSLDKPRLDPVILNRFLVEAESTGIPVAVVLNKADIVSQEVKQAWERRLNGWGYKPHICSVETGTGLSELAPVLENRTSIVFGPSGTGKSSLINALRGSKGEGADVFSDDDDDVRVSEVSRKTGLGRHTTRHVSLLQLPFEGAMLADSPGFSYPSLEFVSSSTLSLLFPEVRSRLENSDSTCAFADCQHISEPGCVVGGDWERYPYYVSLWKEVSKREEHEKSVFGTKQKIEFRYKTGVSGMKQAEPLLVMKKHRRVSRKHTRQLVDGEVREQREEHRELQELQNPQA